MLSSNVHCQQNGLVACAIPSSPRRVDKRVGTTSLLVPLPFPLRKRRRSLLFCSAVQDDSKKVEDVVIVGGGIAGVAMGLALHKLGIKSRVLEQSPTLRSTGAALGVWTNGWHALDALGVADSLRGQFTQASGFQFCTPDNKCLSDLVFSSSTRHVELRAVDRHVLLETMANALPTGIVSYDSKVTKINTNEGSYSQVELKDGSSLSAKVIVGCDGIGSVVAKGLGLKKAHYAGYVGIRGVAAFPEGHMFSTLLRQTVGQGVRMGCFPMDSNRVYWFLVFNDSQERKIQDSDLVKKEALSLVNGFNEELINVVQRTPADSLSRAGISDRWMWPWSLSQLHRRGITVAGDAMHPVTPNLAQGGCSALEDGVVLARILSRLFKGMEEENLSVDDELKKIELALDEYTTQRQKRMLGLGIQANLIGKFLQVEGDLFCSIRDGLLPRILTVDSFISHTFYNVGVLA